MSLVMSSPAAHAAARWAGVFALALPLSVLSGGEPRGGTSASGETPPTVAEEGRLLKEILADARQGGYLPLRFAFEVADRLIVREYQAPGLAMAFYAPRATATSSSAPPPAAGDLEAAAKGGVVFLARKTYFLATGGGDATVRPISELPVDATEYLFKALLEAYFDLVIPADCEEGGGEYGRKVAGRAEEVMAPLPAPHRRQAYVQAVTDFGAHVLSVANQFERSARLHRERDTDLCGKIGRPGTLFALWEKLFTDAPYPARYYLPAEPASTPGEAPSPGRWVETGLVLAAEDKRLFVHYVFDDFWQGTLRQDVLARYCP